MNKVLLINDNYQPLAFISERKAIKLIVNSKVEILSFWTGMKISYVNGFMDYPSTIKMKYNVRFSQSKLNFSKRLILRRDRYTCGYCEAKYNISNLTIDHILPKSLGGKNSFTNCITACIPCNRRKGAKTLQESNMKLKKIPFVPKRHLCYYSDDMIWHSDWFFYV